MKYILIIVLIACCTYIGIGVSKYYSKRRYFFSDLVLFMDKLRLDISFSKEKIGVIIKNFQEGSRVFEKLKVNFLNILENNHFDEKKLFEGINILKENEKTTLTIFFKSLGRFDSINQTNQIKVFKEEIKKLESNCINQYQKFGSLSIKLGFIVGVLLALILV